MFLLDEVRFCAIFSLSSKCLFRKYMYHLWLGHLAVKGFHLSISLIKRFTLSCNSLFLQYWVPVVDNIQSTRIFYPSSVKTVDGLMAQISGLLPLQFHIQWNLDSSFSSGVWKRNDGSGKTIDAGAYIKLIKTIRFAYMYLLNQKTYTNNALFPLSSPLCITPF
jgi:hypothetical protein